MKLHNLVDTSSVVIGGHIDFLGYVDLGADVLGDVGPVYGGIDCTVDGGCVSYVYCFSGVNGAASRERIETYCEAIFIKGSHTC